MAQLLQMNMAKPKKPGQPHTLVLKNVHDWPVTVDIMLLGSKGENIERCNLTMEKKKQEKKDIPVTGKQIKVRAWVFDQTVRLKVTPPDANGKVSVTIVSCQNLSD